MSIPFRSFALAVLLVFGASAADAQTAPPAPPAPLPSVQLKFGGTDYFLRWSQNHQHEFTPKGQVNLDIWTDMITVTIYPQVTDGEGLARAANGVLSNYKNGGATLLRTDSVPATADRPAQHFIAVAFPQPEFIEAAFARFVIVDGVGSAVIYSHRIHGKQAGDAMSAWLAANGTAIEQRLMALHDIPTRRMLEPAR